MSTSDRRAWDGAVVVGVDGSTSALAAVDLAAREAVLRDRPLRIVHAFIWPTLHVPLGPSPEGPPEGGLRHEAERFVADTVAQARATVADIEVSGEVVAGAAASVLLACSRVAALVVIGDRGLGGFTGLLVGSVAVQLAAHAACPVLVARGEPDGNRPVLLGVDGSPANASAVGFAFEEAALRGVPLVALHAWAHPIPAGPGDMRPLVHDVDETRADEERVVAEALAGWSEMYPDVVVDRVLIRGGTRPTLIEATGRAQLIVVGSRGHGGFVGLLLGSVSQAALHHARCAVAVVRHSDDHPDSTR